MGSAIFLRILWSKAERRLLAFQIFMHGSAHKLTHPLVVFQEASVASSEIHQNLCCATVCVARLLAASAPVEECIKIDRLRGWELHTHKHLLAAQYVQKCCRRLADHQARERPLA